MKLILVLVLVVSAYGKLSSPLRESVCPEGFKRIADSCYKFHQIKKTWASAQKACELEDSHLVSVVTSTQYSNILNHIAKTNPGQYWLSGCYVGNSWMWTSNGSSMKKSWFGRIPDNICGQCAYFCSLTNKYWGTSANVSKRFICEKNLKSNCDIPLSTIPLY